MLRLIRRTVVGEDVANLRFELGVEISVAEMGTPGPSCVAHAFQMKS